MNSNALDIKKKSIFILILLTFLTFGNVLNHGFVGDDEMTIVYNDFYTSLTNLPILFSKQYISESQDYFSDKTRYSSSGGVSYRPVSAFIFFSDYWLWKRVPFGWHLTNLLLHITNTILVYLILLNLLGKENVALLAACLFGIHPIQSEAVAAISYRHDLLATFLALTSILSYVNFSMERRKPFLILSLLAYFLGLFAKESVLGLPLVLICYDRISGENKQGIISRPSLLIYSLYFFIAVFYLWVYIFCFPSSVLSANHFGQWQLIAHMALIFKIFFLYAIGLCWPFAVKGVPPLYAPAISPGFDFDVFGGACIFLFLLGGLFYSFRRHRTIFFLMIWFCAFYIPASNLIVLANPMAHRFMYLPSIGFFAIWAFAIERLVYFFQKISKSVVISQSIVIGYLIACMLIAFMLSFSWKSNAMLAFGWVKEYPLDPKGYSILGIEYYRSGDCENAKKYFLKNIELGSRDPRSYYYAGACSLENLDQKEYYFNKVIEMSPAYSLAYQSLGEVYFQKHQYSQSINVLKKAIMLNASVTSYKYMILSEGALKHMENVTAVYQEAIKRFNNPNEVSVLKAAYEQVHGELGIN